MARPTGRCSCCKPPSLHQAPRTDPLRAGRTTRRSRRRTDGTPRAESAARVAGLGAAQMSAPRRRRASGRSWWDATTSSASSKGDRAAALALVRAHVSGERGVGVPREAARRVVADLRDPDGLHPEAPGAEDVRAQQVADVRRRARAACRSPRARRGRSSGRASARRPRSRTRRTRGARGGRARRGSRGRSVRA